MKKEYFFAVITILLWSMQAACCKMMMGNLGPIAVLFYTAGFASVTLFVINLVRGGIRSFLKYKAGDYLRIILLGFAGIFLYTALYYIGLDHLTSQVACIINYMWPAMIVLFSCVILKEHFSARKALAIVCAFAGVMVISLQDGVGALSGGSLTGVLACLGAAVCYGFFSTMNKKYDYDQWIMLWAAFTVAAVCAGIYCAVTGSFGQVTGTDWFWLAWIGAVGDGIAYVLWGLALNRGNTARISILAYLTPFMALLWGRVLLGEHISALSLAGLILIIGGVLIQMRESQEAVHLSDKKPEVKRTMKKKILIAAAALVIAAGILFLALVGLPPYTLSSEKVTQFLDDSEEGIAYLCGNEPDADDESIAVTIAASIMSDGIRKEGSQTWYGIPVKSMQEEVEELFGEDFIIEDFKGNGYVQLDDNQDYLARKLDWDDETYSYTIEDAQYGWIGSEPTIIKVHYTLEQKETAETEAEETEEISETEETENLQPAGCTVVYTLAADKKSPYSFQIVEFSFTMDGSN